MHMCNYSDMKFIQFFFTSSSTNSLLIETYFLFISLQFPFYTFRSHKHPTIDMIYVA